MLTLHVDLSLAIAKPLKCPTCGCYRCPSPDFTLQSPSLGLPLEHTHSFPVLTSDSCLSLHKHGSSMASNSNSSESQRIAQQRLRIIAGHLQKQKDDDSGIIATECKAEANKGTVPRKR